MKIDEARARSAIWIRACNDSGVSPGSTGTVRCAIISPLSIPASTLSHHLKTLIIVGLVSQERDATTLICRANYPMMRGLVNFLVAECCTEADCASIRQQTDTAA
jgi:DNA-binding transcriptional ArsR family regulator